MGDRKGQSSVTKVPVNYGKYNGIMNTDKVLGIAMRTTEKVRQVLHIAKTRDR